MAPYLKALRHFLTQLCQQSCVLIGQHPGGEVATNRVCVFLSGFLKYVKVCDLQFCQFTVIVTYHSPDSDQVRFDQFCEGRLKQNSKVQAENVA